MLTGHTPDATQTAVWETRSLSRVSVARDSDFVHLSYSRISIKSGVAVWQCNVTTICHKIKKKLKRVFFHYTFALDSILIRDIAYLKDHIFTDKLVN